MSTTKSISNKALLNIVKSKAQNVISAPQAGSVFTVTSNPTLGSDGNYFFNIDAMSSYHVDQAEAALKEGRYSDATKGFTVTVWENQLPQLPNIFKGAQVVVEITSYTNDDGVDCLGTKLIKAMEPTAPKTQDMSSRFASFVVEDDEIED